MSSERVSDREPCTHCNRGHVTSMDGSYSYDCGFCQGTGTRPARSSSEPSREDDLRAEVERHRLNYEAMGDAWRDAEARCEALTAALEKVRPIIGSDALYAEVEAVLSGVSHPEDRP